ncbi:MAG: glycosyltransferase family 39 protein [Elusimicrobiota bacterium]
MLSRSAKRSLWVLGAIVCHFILGQWYINIHSATFDEPMYIAAGASLWRSGDARMDQDNPALAKLLVSAPLLFQKLTVPWDTREWRGGYHYAFGERLLYFSGNDADRILLCARSVGLVLSGLLGLLLWRFARHAWGELPAGLCLVFYCFSPTLLAHAALATNDFLAVFFSVLGLMACLSFLERPEPGAALGVAAASLAAFLCKYSAILLWPAYVLLFLRAWAAGEIEGRPRLRSFTAYAVLPWLAGAAAYLALCPGGWEGVATRLWQVTAGEHPSFLLGRVSKSGWLWYYAAAFLLKSTLPELAVAAGGIWLLVRKRTALSAKAWMPAVVVLLYLAAASVSRKQIGVRYVLLVYPMLALLAAVSADALARRFRYGKQAAVLLGAGQLLAAVACAPHFLAYFNPLAGGPAGGYKVLVDSNLDWGQELKALAAFHRSEGEPEVVLSYFGTASPEYHGIRAQQVLSTNSKQRRLRNSQSPEKEWLVVSATNLQGAYFGPDTLAWLKDMRPIRRIGHGLFVYDITGDAPAHRRLAEVYAAMGDASLASWERGRAYLLSSGTAGP